MLTSRTKGGRSLWEPAMTRACAVQNPVQTGRDLGVYEFGNNCSQQNKVHHRTPLPPHSKKCTSSVMQRPRVTRLHTGNTKARGQKVRSNFPKHINRKILYGDVRNGNRSNKWVLSHKAILNIVCKQSGRRLTSGRASIMNFHFPPHTQ